MYLKVRRRNAKGRCVTDPAFEDANSAYERALVFMHKVLYCIAANKSHFSTNKSTVDACYLDLAYLE